MSGSGKGNAATTTLRQCAGFVKHDAFFNIARGAAVALPLPHKFSPWNKGGRNRYHSENIFRRHA